MKYAYVILLILILTIISIITHDSILSKITSGFVTLQSMKIKYENLDLVNFIKNHTFENIQYNTGKKLELNLEKNDKTKCAYFVIHPLIINYNRGMLSTPAKSKSSLNRFIPFCTELLTNILPHIELNGKSVSLDDCRIIDILNYSGSLFPKLHNDLEWTYFSPDTSGFQVWYLLKNNNVEQGNMFVSKIHESCGVQQTEMINDELLFHNNGAFLKNGKPLNEKFSLYLSDLDLKYVNIKEGECFVFHKNLLHMSDPRTSRTRIAISFRVAVCDKKGKLTVNNVKNDNYLRFKNHRIAHYINQIPDDCSSKEFPISQFELI